MAAKTHGTVYLFGVDGTYLGSTAQILSIARSQSDKINEMIYDNSGHLVASIHDDQTDSLDISYVIVSAYTRPTIAAKVTLAAGGGATFDGDYRVVDYSESKSAKGFTECKMTLVKDEYLTLT